MQFWFTKAASTGTNIPSHPNTPHGLQANAQRQRNILLMKKTLEFWLKPVHLMHQAWKHHAILIHQSCHKCQSHGNTMEIWPQAAGLSQMLHKLKTQWKSDPWKLSHMLHKLKTQCNSSTGTNTPSPPDKAHGLQANAQRQRNITLMEKNIGILTQTCPPNAPSMETPCNSDSPKLPAQGQTSQAIQIHHMASKQMLRDREISH